MNKNALNFLKIKADFNSEELFLLGYLTGVEGTYENILRNNYPDESEEKIEEVLFNNALNYAAAEHIYESVAEQLQITEEVRPFALFGFRDKGE